MAYYLDFDGLDDQVDAIWAPASTFSLEVDVETPASIPGNSAIIELYDADGTERIGIRSESGFWKIATVGKTPGTGSAIPTNTRLTVRLDWDGVEFVLYVDGVENYRVTPTSSAFLSSLDSLIIGRGQLALTDSFGINLYLCTVVRSGVTAHKFDPSASNGTGSVLPDTVGTNDGTLGNFPTDDSQWVSYVGAPSLTVTQATLTPGGTISGTYADYDTIPTTLTVSDGTNTITIASPTITDNGDGTGSFSGTMPALPTTGTANLVLFGDVTVELA